MNNSNDITKRGSVGVYVPPSRRNRVTVDDTSTILPVSNDDDVHSKEQIGITKERFRGRGFTDEYGYGTKIYDNMDAKHISSYGNDEKIKSIDEADVMPVIYEDTPKCTIYLSNIATDLSEIGKSNILTPYMNKGALSQWISPSEAILVFPTVGVTRTAMALPRASSYQMYCLYDISDNVQYESLLKAAQDLHRQVKPDRDVRVANRMIASALGVRVKRTDKKPSNTISASDGMGAWDD